MSTAILFPGQGAQAVGMGKDVHDALPAARDLFRQASDILGLDLAKLCFEGPQDQLTRTDVSQPAILVTSLALLEGVKARRPEWLAEATATAGLSLGEYTALVFAGVLTFAEAVWLIQQRGKAMQDACAASPGGMASVLGLETAKVAEACAHAQQQGLGVVIPANLNSPGQVVISGAKPAVEAAAAKAKELGARRALPLAVAGAFHSPLMAPAQAALKTALQDVLITPARIPVWSNVTAAPMREPAEIRRLLGEQVVSPVRWEEAMRAMAAAGVRRVVEVGPGTVLTGLMKKIDASVETRNVATLKDLEAA
jgi:[acyl-carrier-protein] S-malonyltransferase